MSSVSHILRQTREAKGISLEEVAQRTYIKLPYLVALEEGDIEKLPAPVYIHGYIRQYAKLLGLNGSELVLQYQQDAGRGNHQPAKLALSPTSRIASLMAERTAELEAQRAAAPSFPPPDMRETSLKRMPEPATLVEAPRQPEPMVLEAPRQPEPIVMEVPRQPEYAEPALIERKVPQAEPAVRETVMAAEPTVRELAEPSIREPKADISLRELAPEPAAPAAPLAPWEVQQAKQQAQQILNSAQREAHEMRVAAERYADQVLAQLESEVNRTLQTVRNGRAYLQSKRRKAQES